MGNTLKSVLRRFGIMSLTVFLAGMFFNCHPGLRANDPSSALPAVIKGSVILAPSFSGPEREAIVAAMREWQAATNGAVQLVVSDNPDREFMEMMTVYKAQQEALAAQRAAARHPGAEDAATSDDEADDEDEQVDDGPDGVLDQTTNFWDSSAGCSTQIVIVRTTSHDPAIQAIDESFGLTPGHIPDGYGIQAYTHPTCRLKYIKLVADRLTTAKHFQMVVEHELGHMWGLRHSFQKWSGVMYAEEEQTECVTAADTAEFCDRWHCDPKKTTPRVCSHR